MTKSESKCRRSCLPSCCVFICVPTAQLVAPLRVVFVHLLVLMEHAVMGTSLARLQIGKHAVFLNPKLYPNPNMHVQSCAYNRTPKTCTPAYGTWCPRKSPSPSPKPTPHPHPAPKHHPSPKPKPPSPAPHPSPSPAPSRAVRYAGINLAGFDYGTLARAGSIWCTDADCSSGGWSDPRVPEQDNCPGYGLCCC